MHLTEIALVSYFIFLFSSYEAETSFAFARKMSAMGKHVHGRYLIDNKFYIGNHRNKI